MSLIPQGERGPPGPEGPQGPPGSQVPLSTILGIGNNAGTNVIDMNEQRIINLGVPTEATDATNKSYTDTKFLAKSGGAMTANAVINMSGGSLLNTESIAVATLSSRVSGDSLNVTSPVFFESGSSITNAGETVLGSTVQLTNLAEVAKPDVVYIDKTNGTLSYGTLPAVSTPPLSDVLAAGRTTGGLSIDFASNTNIENCVDGNITHVFAADISVLPGVGQPYVGVNDDLLFAGGKGIFAADNLVLGVPSTNEIQLRTGGNDVMNVKPTEVVMKQNVKMDMPGDAKITASSVAPQGSNLILGCAAANSVEIEVGTPTGARTLTVSQFGVDINDTLTCHNSLDMDDTAISRCSEITTAALKGANVALDTDIIFVGESGKATTITGLEEPATIFNIGNVFNMRVINAVELADNGNVTMSLTPSGINLNSVASITGADSVSTNSITIGPDSALNGQVLTYVEGQPAAWADIPAQATPTLAEVMFAGNSASRDLDMAGYNVNSVGSIGIQGNIVVADTTKLIGINDTTGAAAVPNLVAIAADGTLSYQQERTLFSNTKYVNDGVTDIQAAVNSASPATVIYMSAGSYGGSTVTVSGKDNIAIVGPAIGAPSTICELASRGMTIESTSQRIRVANLQVEGTFTVAGTGVNYYNNVYCGGTLDVLGSGSHFFYDCEFDGPVQVAPDFAGVVAFIRGNFAGASFTLLQASPAQVQFTLCLNLPVSRPANAVYSSANSNTAGVLTENVNVIAPILGSGSFTTTGCASLGSSLAISGQELSLVAQSGATLNSVTLPDVPTPGLEAVLEAGNSAGAYGIDMNAQTLSNVQTIRSQTNSGMSLEASTSIYITNPNNPFAAALIAYPSEATPRVYIPNLLQAPAIESVRTLTGFGGATPLNIDTGVAGTVSFKTGGTEQFKYDSNGFQASNNMELDGFNMRGAATVALTNVEPKSGATQWTASGCASLGADLTYDSGTGSLTLVSQTGATLGSVTITGGGGGGGGTGFYEYNANLADTVPPPGSGNIRWDNAVQTDATNLYVSHLTRIAQDIDVFLAAIVEGDILIIQDQNDSANYQKWAVSGTPTSTPNTYFTFPVTLVDSSVSFTNGHNIALIPIAAAKGVQAVSAGQGVTVTGTATEPIVNADVADIAQGRGITVTDVAGTFTIDATVADVQAGTGISVTSDNLGVYTVSSTATTPSLSTVLAAGNSAGAYNIMMNQQSVADALTVSTTNLTSSQVTSGDPAQIFVKNRMIFAPTIGGDNVLDMDAGIVTGVAQLNRGGSTAPLYMVAPNSNGVVVCSTDTETAGTLSVGTVKPHPLSTSFTTEDCASLGSSLTYIGNDLSLLSQTGDVLSTVVVSGGGGGGVGSLSQVLGVGNNAGGLSMTNVGGVSLTNGGTGVATPSITGTGSTLTIGALGTSPAVSIDGTLTFDSQYGGAISEVTSITGRVAGGNLDLSTASNSPITLSPYNSLTMYLDTSQRVGIRTNNPTEALEVNGNIKLGSTYKLLGNISGSAASALTASDLTGHSESTLPFYSSSDVLFFAPYAADTLCYSSDGNSLTFTAPSNLTVGAANNVKKAAGLLYNSALDTTAAFTPTNGSLIAWSSGTPISVASSTLVVSRAANITSSGAGLVYNSTVNTTAITNGLGTANQVLLSAGSGLAPVWASQGTLSVGSATSATTATRATNVASGAAGVLFNTAADTTSITSGLGTTGQVLLSAGDSSAPVWTNQSALTIGSATNATNITDGNAGELLYQSAAGVTAKLPAGNPGEVLVSMGASAPEWTNIGTLPYIIPTAQIPVVGPSGTVSTNTWYNLFRTQATYDLPAGLFVLRCRVGVSSGTITATVVAGGVQIQYSTDPTFATFTVLGAGNTFLSEGMPAFLTTTCTIPVGGLTGVYLRGRILFTTGGFNNTQILNFQQQTFSIVPMVEV